MEKYKELIHSLRRNGLSNADTLGHHSGLYELAADAIEKLQADLDTIREETAKELLIKLYSEFDQIDEQYSCVEIKTRIKKYCTGF